MFCAPIFVSAQETVVKKDKLTDAVTQRYSVFKTDKTVKQGLYVAFISNTKNALARGIYTNNVKTGWWDFYDDANNLIQRYDYTRKKLLVEAVEDTSSFCRYFVDDSLKNSPDVTKPVRIGSRFYGYINYLKAFKLPRDFEEIDPSQVGVRLELLVSPYGRLADFAVHFQSFRFTRTLHFNLDILTDEDKTFIPATINNKPVSCRIFIRCILANNGKLDFER